MASTPTWAIPYPVGTDRVADGDNAMQALAERCDYLFTATYPPPFPPDPPSTDVPWTSVPPAAGWVDAGNGFLIKSEWIFFRLYVNRAAWPAGTVVCTLPAAARPANVFYGLAVGVQSAAPQSFGITNGVVTAFGPSTGSGGGLNAVMSWPRGI